MRDVTTRREHAFYIRMIRSLIAVIVVLLLVCGLLTVLLLRKPKQNGTAAAPTADSSSAVTSSRSPEEEALYTLAKGLSDWNLLLINKSSPLPENFSIETATIQADFARDVGMVFDARAVANLNAMCAAAKAENLSLLVISCYRPHQRQVSLFNNELDKVKTNNPALSENEAVAKASTVVAYPGTSEHEGGLAVDLNSDQETFANTAQFTWLQSHAAEYGFVLRYPKDKQSVTGVIYEPWHYRYVGPEHAKKMNELGYCLEEYYNYLKPYAAK